MSNVSSWLPNLIGPVEVQDTGTALTARGALNFIGATIVDNAADNSTDITLAVSSAPTGTGIPHIVAGVQDAAASLIVNADVHASAAIAASKVVQATGTGFPHVAGGVLDAASVKVDTTNAAHVTVPATANGVVTSSGTVLQQASNVLAEANLLSVGASPAAAGNGVRLANAYGVYGRNAGGIADIAILETDAADFVYVGQSGAGTKQATGLSLFASNNWQAGLGANVLLELTTGRMIGALPFDGGTSPYSVHGVAVSAMTDAGYTVPASEYRYSCIEVPSTLTLTVGAKAFKLPTPATEAASYDIEVWNLTTGGFALTVGRADGAGVTYSLLNGKRANFKMRPAGAYLDTTTIT